MDFVKLNELCDFEKGSTGLAKAEPGNYPLVATGAARKTCNAYQFDTKAVCIPLVSSTGHGHASLNNVHYQEGKFALGTILVALTNKDENRLNIQFLHLYLSQLKDQILVPLMSGAANVALSVKKIQNVEIPLPPIERQREIVENFKSIVIEEDQLKSELTHQQTLLKKLRQQILQEAIEGKLTADWRVQNPDVEPARKLLEHITAEKAQLVKDKKIKKQKPLPPISEGEKPFELPEGWEWCRFQDVAEIASNLVDPYLYYDLPHIAPNHIQKNTGKILQYKSAREDEIISGKHLFDKGQLLYSKVRPQLNKVAFAPCKGLCSADMYPIESHVEPAYLQKLMLSGFFLGEVSKFDNRVKMPKINQNQLNSIMIPIAPTVEQQAIVTKVEKLLTFCDQLETQITQNQTHAERLMQAVLKEAFQSEQQTTSHQSETSKPVKTQKLDNVVLFKPKKADYYKRMLLAAEIVHQLHRQPTLGHLKLQKLIYLCQKIEQMQLPTNFLQQAAGPYDPEMARSLDQQLKDKKWFRYQREEKLKYLPLENAGEHRADFDKYFAEQKEGIHSLINLFRKEKSDHMEIVATLYACWERLLQEKAVVSDEMIFERFYQWSEEKAKYPLMRLKTVIQWMCKQDIVPTLWKNR